MKVRQQWLKDGDEKRLIESNWHYMQLRSTGDIFNHGGITELYISIPCKKNDDGCLFQTLMALEKKKLPNLPSSYVLTLTVL